MPKANEATALLEFNGWKIDIFQVVNGDLGITVERLPVRRSAAGMPGGESRDPENPSVDIFVSRKLKVRSDAT